MSPWMDNFYRSGHGRCPVYRGTGWEMASGASDHFLHLRNCPCNNVKIPLANARGVLANDGFRAKGWVNETGYVKEDTESE